jgi:GNAT superfamily N-acetyltransferase
VDITYRPAKCEDLEDAERVVQEAGNELRVRHGRRPWPAPPPIAFPKFCLAEDPDGLWVAEHGGTIVGFGFSWMTEQFWFLSQLFVRPQIQAKGVGQALLSKTLMQAQRNGAANRALITPAYNITSTGLYLNNGLYPREPLYRMAAPTQAVAQNLADAGYDATPIAPWPEPRQWMARPAPPLSAR